MKILGIDPGSRITGYGLVEKRGPHLVHIDNGGIFTHANDSLAQKLHILFRGILDLIDKFSPDAVALENIFYAKNVRSALVLGHARGALMTAALEKQCTVYEYTPLEIKQALVGYGRASKEQIQSMVKQLLNLPEKTYFDASDALAVAICHLNSCGLQQRIQKSQEK